MKSLRRLEYNINTSSIFYHWHRFVNRRLGLKYGISIVPNTVGKGLYIPHTEAGLIINAISMGDYCIVSGGCVVGNKDSQENRATIGNHVELTLGCKVIGKVQFGDNGIVAPNSVVVKDVPANAVVSGIPAKIIKYRKKHLIMKVLLINPEHALLGGAHTVYLNTADMLRLAGVEVIFFAMHCNNEIPCAQSAFFAKPNNRRNVLKYVKNNFYNRDAARCLQRLIDAERPDIAHVHLMWGGLSPSILDVLKKNKVPVVHTVHDYAMLCSRATLKGNDGAICEKCAGGNYCQSFKTRCNNGSALKGGTSALEMILRNKRHHPVHLIDHFHFVSQFCADKHCEMDTRFMDTAKTVLYNIPDQLVVQIAKETASDTYEGYYLYYGRLAYEKGIGTLIEAFKDKPHIQLKVVGTGPMENVLKEKCSNLNIKNVEFLGFKSGEELYHIVQNAKFVCVPSEWYENNPMTIIEAYTLSTPVVAARIGGIPEIVEDQSTGFLFPSGDVESLKSTIDKCESLSKEAYCQMKNNAQNFAKVKFKRDKYAQRLCSIYQQTINTYRG